MNAQGDFIGLLDIDGNIIVKYVYDKWGNHVVIDDCGEQIFVNSLKYRSFYVYKKNTRIFI